MVVSLGRPIRAMCCWSMGYGMWHTWKRGNLEDNKNDNVFDEYKNDNVDKTT